MCAYVLKHSLCFDRFQLPWPLGGILYSTESSKRMYSRITGLLFQVQTVKFAIEQSFFLKSKPRPAPELSIFWKLRIRFLSTMNDLWSYFMMTVSIVHIFHRLVHRRRRQSMTVLDWNKVADSCFSSSFVGT